MTFNLQAASHLTRSVLAGPPLRRHTVRVSPVGDLKARFVLPLTVCPTTNTTRHGQAWKLAKLKSTCLALMRSQLPAPGAWPLTGRPQVLCVRFSSVEPDAFSDWAKIPVDCLVKMGLLVDDRPSCISLHQWAEPAPRGQGCALIEVWSGEGSER